MYLDKNKFLDMKNEYKLLTGGIILVVSMYLIPSLMGYLWLGLFLALLTSTVFLGILYQAGKKNYKESSSSKTTLIFFVLLVSGSLFVFGFDYYKADFQKDILREIRVTIDSGIIEGEIRSDLLNVYREHMVTNKDGDKSVVDLASEFYGDRLTEKNIFLVKDEALDKDLNFLFYKDRNSDSFSIYSVAEHSIGWGDNFENRDGSVGRLQTKTTLTSEGVTHERQN